MKHFRNLQAWIDKTKALLEDTTRPVDVASAGELLKKHQELNEDIEGKKYEFDYVRDLGRRLLQKNPALNDVCSHLSFVVSFRKRTKRRDWW